MTASTLSCSIIVPCLWSNTELFEMTTASLLNLLDEPLQIIVIADRQPYSVNANVGLRAATGDIIIVTNNDIGYIQFDWLKHLLLPLETGYDISSIRTSDSDGWGVEPYIEDGAKFGSIFAMRRKVYETIGGFDEQFKGYFADLDYQKRAEDAGFRVGKNHAGIVEHQGKATYSQTDPDDTEFESARDIFIAKYGKVW